jgi:hypothetical protein
MGKERSGLAASPHISLGERKLETVEKLQRDGALRFTGIERLDKPFSCMTLCRRFFGAR